MALPFFPDPGTILICDFRGFEKPEIVKKRPVVVVSPRRRDGQKLCTVVPLSTATPQKIEKYHVQLNISPALPRPFDSPTCWVKGDLLYTVSHERLDRPHVKNPYGPRTYPRRCVTPEDLEKIRECLLHGLGLLP